MLDGRPRDPAAHGAPRVPRPARGRRSCRGSTTCWSTARRSLGLLTVNAFAAAQEVLIPIQCEYYALEGLSQLLKNIELIKAHLNPGSGVDDPADDVRRPHPARGPGRRRGARRTSPRRCCARPSRARCASPRRRATAQTVMTYDPARAARCRTWPPRRRSPSAAPHHRGEHPMTEQEARPRTRPGRPDPQRRRARRRRAAGRRLLPGRPPRRRSRRRPSDGAARTRPRPTPPVEPAGRRDDDLLPVPGARFAELPVGAIVPNPRQPRTVFDEDALAELVHSVARDRRAAADRGAAGAAGRRQDGPRYELVMGERRWRAAQAAGLDDRPGDRPRDRRRRPAARRAAGEPAPQPAQPARGGRGVRPAARRLRLHPRRAGHAGSAGRRPQISNTIRLLSLPPLVQRRVAAGVLSAGHARALLGLADAAAMERLAQRIVAEGLSVRATEEIVALGGDDEPAPRRRRRAPRARPARGARRPRRPAVGPVRDPGQGRPRRRRRAG